MTRRAKDRPVTRRNGRFRFGSGDDAYSMPDPWDEALVEAMWRVRYAPEPVTRADLFRMLAAVEAYQYLANGSTLGDTACAKLRDLRRAVRESLIR